MRSTVAASEVRGIDERVSGQHGGRTKGRHGLIVGDRRACLIGGERHADVNRYSVMGISWVGLDLWECGLFAGGDVKRRELSTAVSANDASVRRTLSREGETACTAYTTTRARRQPRPARIAR
jgi:hypothetical protein